MALQDNHVITTLCLNRDIQMAYYCNAFANNNTMSFIPAITGASARMHGEFLRPSLFLQAYRETVDYFHFMGVPAQPNQLFRFHRAAFYSGLKSKVGLISVKAAALRVNINTDGYLLASHVASRYPSTSHAPSLLISSLSINVRPPCMHWCVGSTLSHTSRGLRPPHRILTHFPPRTRLPLYHHSSCNE